MKNKNLFFRIAYMLKPYKKMIFYSMALSILITLANTAIPIVQQKLIDDGLLKTDIEMLVMLTLGMIMLTVSIRIIMYFNSSIQINLNVNFIRKMQLNVLNHSLKLKPNYLRNDGILKIINDANFNIQSIAIITGSEFFTIFLQIFKVLGIAIGLAIIDWRLTLFVLVTIPIRLFISNMLSKVVKKVTVDSITAHGEIHKWEADVYNSVNEIKLWNLYGKKNNEYEHLLKQRDKASKKLGLTTLKENLLGDTAQNIIFNLIYIISAFLIWNSDLTIGGLLAFISYSTLLLEPVALISTIKMILGVVEPSLNSYENFLNFEVEENDNEERERKSITLSEEYSIRFDNVSFGYPENNVLKNASFNIYSGEKVALVGENGSGKTTLINLLLRFYEPTDGCVFINDINARDTKLNDYRDLFSVVSQFPNLFQGTIYNNITVFGENSIDNKDLKEIELLDFVYQLPDQMETLVGNDSGNISGGEKQKIALIRAMLKNKSNILIMDEPTSNYDVQSTTNFEVMLQNMTKETVIVITHRPEMLKLVDKIIEIKSGQTVVHNSYEDFKKNSLVYALQA
ncbi:Lipid A export ATP-binding/permease protein MsbA [compost metagenome]